MNQQNAKYSDNLANLMLEVTSKKSYRQLARDAGTSPSTISNMVLGRIPSREMALRVAEASRVPLKTMMEACNYEMPNPDDYIRHYVKACRGTMDKENMAKHILEILEEEANEPEGYEAEL